MALPSPQAKPPRRRTRPVYYTTAMVDALNAAVEARGAPFPRYECVYGELLVTMNPPRVWHQVVRERLYRALVEYARGEAAAGYVGITESKFTFQRTDTNVSPDIWAVRLEELRADDWDALTVPLLLAEVLSPGTGRRDRFQKRRAYLEAGTPLYWIVDARSRSVEVWTPGLDFPRVEREQLVWHPAGVGAPFTLALAELFAPI
jgi:Uma2 family endonuclease